MPRRSAAPGAMSTRPGRYSRAPDRALVSLLQARFDETVEVTVEHGLRIPDLDPRSQILDAALVEHVGPDLVAPADVGLGALDLGGLGAALLHLELVELRLQLLHGGCLVLVLGAVALALHDDVGRQVRDADRGFRPVDVLAAGAARTVDVDAQVGRIDLDLDLVVDLRGDEDGCERGVAAVTRIERRLAHQPVHARLRAQPPVGVLALDADGRALDAGDLPGRELDDLGLEPVVFGPAEVHPEEHFGPVLRLGAARPGLDVEERVRRVHLAAEHAPELELLHPALVAVELAQDLGGGGLVLLLLCELDELARVGKAGRQRSQAAADFLEVGALPSQRLRALGLLPDAGLLELALDFGEALGLSLVVKD